VEIFVFSKKPDYLFGFLHLNYVEKNGIGQGAFIPVFLGQLTYAETAFAQLQKGRTSCPGYSGQLTHDTNAITRDNGMSAEECFEHPHATK
jgi:hypothetical protein